MLDKNGTEMKTGMIVEISGAFFKNDNGLWFIEHSPGDPGWNGKDYCLYKIGKTGKISKTRYNICFWPLHSVVSDHFKTAQANAWNSEFAAIEVVSIPNTQEVKAHFQEQADAEEERLRDYSRRWPEDHPTISLYQAIKAHRQSVADGIV